MRSIYTVIVLCVIAIDATAQTEHCSFGVLAFYTAKTDLAHISFVNEAKTWFSDRGHELGYNFEATSDWTRLNSENMEGYDLVIFLDSRPEDSLQRQAFKSYMEEGGAWMGFHFAGFALTPSDYPQDWDWYHNDFLGSGMYRSNTWQPTSAVLRVEDPLHPLTKSLPAKFKSAPNEWYRWERDLTVNPDILILLAIDPASFPLGTGPKPHEIWHKGYYPVVWTNIQYRMAYFNMGHNHMDYEGGTNQTLSSTFASEAQNTLIANALLWLGRPGDSK